MTATTMSDVRRTAPWVVLALFAGAILMTIFLLVTVETEPVRRVTMHAAEPVATEAPPAAPQKPDGPSPTPAMVPTDDQPLIQLDEVRVVVPHGTARAVLSRSATPAVLPDRPDRADVVQALEWTRALARSCVENTAYEGRRIDMHVHVSPSGTVTIAEIEGDLAGTAEGSCVARAMRRAVLPRFSGAPLVVRYPLQL